MLVVQQAVSVLKKHQRHLEGVRHDPLKMAPPTDFPTANAWLTFENRSPAEIPRRGKGQSARLAGVEEAGREVVCWFGSGHRGGGHWVAGDLSMADKVGWGRLSAGVTSGQERSHGSQSLTRPAVIGRQATPRGAPALRQTAAGAAWIPVWHVKA